MATIAIGHLTPWNGSPSPIASCRGGSSSTVPVGASGGGRNIDADGEVPVRRKEVPDAPQPAPWQWGVAGQLRPATPAGGPLLSSRGGREPRPGPSLPDRPLGRRSVQLDQRRLVAPDAEVPTRNPRDRRHP